MKVYRYYRKPSDQALSEAYDLSIKDKYPLYAYTNNKEFRERFIHERNMDNFIEIVSKMDKEEYMEFGNSNPSARLSIYQYLHFSNFNHGKHIDVLTTWNEKEICQACLDDSLTEINEALDYNFFPLIFKDKYIKALKRIEFMGFWKLAKADRFEQFFTEEEAEEYLDYSVPEVMYDELAMLIHLFGNDFSLK